jgi:hypothetical protein
MEICFGESRDWLLVLHLSHLKRQMGNAMGNGWFRQSTGADYVLDGGTVAHKFYVPNLKIALKESSSPTLACLYKLSNTELYYVTAVFPFLKQ